MKSLKKLTSLLLITLVSAASLIGCSFKKMESCPFTTASWDYSVEQIEELEGEAIETYDSIYGGDTYTFSKEYLGKDGIIKYMFNEENELACIAWTYTSDSMSELDEVYSTILSDLEDTYGSSEYDDSQVGSAGNVWRLKDGRIITSYMATADLSAIQIGYINKAATE